MDPVVTNVFTRMARNKCCSPDDILETPELRLEFLSSCRRTLGYLPERALLHRLTDLRKSGKLPRTRELTKTCPRIAGQCLRR